MAWIFLAESEDSAWPLHHGSDLSPIVRTTDMLKLFYCLGCEAVDLRPPEYGTTLPRSYLACCPDMKLISSTVDSPARMQALQALKKVWVGAEPDYFGRLQGLPMKLSRNSSFSKMYQESRQMDLMKSHTPFPRWAMIVDGKLYQLTRTQPYLKVKGGFAWPRPRASESRRGRGKNAAQMRRRSPSMSALYFHRYGELIPATWPEWMMGYPRGWTGLAPWAMPLYQRKREKHLCI